MSTIGGSFRKQVYKILEGISGRTLTEKEHDELKGVLIAYVKSCAPDYTPQPPVEHIFTCKNCGGISKTAGNKQTKIFKRNNAPSSPKLHLSDGEGDEDFV